ncbi:TraB/GumN family protein [Parafilimonas sp.]|uniref:TraB/GumN family protein n=1 Tax=Parafilimonas sp. TaxID=1969739 RepID=UPI0039E43E6B
MLRNRMLIALLILFFNSAFAQTLNTVKYPSLFWEITGNGLKKPSYLFGTMHVSNKIAFHLSDSFYNAIQSTDMVALELNPECWQKDMVRMNAAQEEIEHFYKDNTTQYITESSFEINDYYDKLKPALTADPQQINSLLYRTFSVQQDYEENTYLDLYIYQTGRKYGKLAGGVEDYYQTQKILFEAYAAMAKEKMKRSSSNNRNAAPDMDKKIQEAYRRGNLDLLDSLEHISFNSTAYINKFLYERNKIQANSIDTLIKKHSLFAGVGAAHLPGANGVIELLRAKGYRLRPVYMQDRDATAKDTVEKMKVPVNFKFFTTDDGFISVKTPGPLYKMPQTYKTINDNWQYADMDNGAYYMLTRVHTHAGLLNQNAAAVLQKTDSLLYENIPGRIISKKAIKRNGINGFDIINRTRRGDLQRYNIFVTPFEILVFKMSGNDDYVNSTEAETFFSSISFNRTQASQPVFTSPSAGFHIKFPQFPYISNNAYDADNISKWQFEAFDSATGNAYTVYKKTVTNISFMEEDSFDLSLVERSIKSSDIIDKELSRNFAHVDGYHALKMQFACRNGNYINAEAVLKGPDYYLLIQTSRRKNNVDTVFFNSFGFNNYQYNTATAYTDTLLDFTVQTPVKPVLDSSLVSLMYSVLNDASLLARIQGESYWPRSRYAMFKDDSTGESVLVSMYEYPKYYHVKDSATYWKKQLMPGNDEDACLYKKTAFAPCDSCQGYQLYWRDTNTVRQIINYKILSNNRLYNLYAIVDSSGAESSFIKNFFSTFTAINKNQTSIYTDKTNTFFEDLYSRDSLTKARARNAIGNVYYSADNIDKVVHFINTLSYGEEDYFEMKQKFIAELGYINDSCCKDRIVQALEDIYKKTADTAYFQNEVLKALQHIKTTSSYTALKSLLLQDPPLFDDYDDYGDFFEDFEDSLQLTRTLFPEILQLTTIEDYKAPVIALLSELLDSGYIQAKDYKDYFSKIYFDAKIEMKKQQNTEEKMLEQQSQQSADDDTPAKNIYADNDYEPTDIHAYATLLLPFYDTVAALPKFFNRLLQSRDTSVQLETAVLLIKNNKPVPDSILLNIAAKDNYRSNLFQALEEAGRAGMFPSPYKRQDLMARSVLCGDSEKTKFFDIQPEGKTPVNLTGKKGYVYFFKYKLQEDDDWEIGLSGPQPENVNEAGTDNALTSLTNEKLIAAKPAAEQFNNQLSRLLLLQHKSARHFYENSRNMYGSFDNY